MKKIYFKTPFLFSLVCFTGLVLFSSEEKLETYEQLAYEIQTKRNLTELLGIKVQEQFNSDTEESKEFKGLVNQAKDSEYILAHVHNIYPPESIENKLIDNEFIDDIEDVVVEKILLQRGDYHWGLLFKEQPLMIMSGMGKPEILNDYSYDLYKKRCETYSFCSFYHDHSSENKSVITSGIYLNKITKLNGITFSYPIYENGKHIADFSLDMPIRWIADYDIINDPKTDARIIDAYKKNYFHSQFSIGTPFIMNDNQILIFHYGITDFLLDKIYIFFGFLLISLVIFNLYIRHKLSNEKLSHTEKSMIIDDLTGLYSRRVLENSDFKHAIKDGGSVIYADMNKLKYINDTFGHDVGNDALNFVVKHLLSSIRENDYAIRLGGDEFLVVLPKCNEDRTKEIMNDITNIKDLSFTMFIENITVSCGYSMFDSDNFTEAVNLADKRMYEEKKRQKKDV